MIKKIEAGDEMEERCPECGEIKKIISSKVTVEDGIAYRTFFRGCLNKECKKFKETTAEDKVQISERKEDTA